MHENLATAAKINQNSQSMFGFVFEKGRRLRENTNQSIVLFSRDNSYNIVTAVKLVQTGNSQSLDDLTDSEKVKIPKENPYIYQPETDDPADIIGCYLGTVNLEKGYEVSLDEETGTFTAHWAGDEYYDPKDYIGSYRITDDNYINIRWREAANEYGEGGSWKSGRSYGHYGK